MREHLRARCGRWSDESLGPQGLVTIAVNIPASARPSLSQGADALDETFYNFVCAGVHTIVL